MSGLSEFQIYAAIKSCEATAAKHERGGRPRLAEDARKRERRLRAELTERLEAMLANGQQIPDTFAEVR
jgi:hypothetical protein